MEHAVPETKPRKWTPYHRANAETFESRFYDLIKNGDITLAGEYQLSKEPQRIDIIIIKKNRDAKTDDDRIGQIFRGHNIVEFKSPGKTLSLNAFDKTVHGYAGNYAAQENVKLTDITATMICYRKPIRLLKTLEKEFDYEVLQKYNGIYYINLKGFQTEKTLAIQIIVASELPEDRDSELYLKALGSKNKELLEKAMDSVARNGKRVSPLKGYWLDVMVKKYNLYNKEGKMTVKEKFLRAMEKEGMLADRERKWEQKGIQKGRQEGMQQVLALLEKGYSPKEVKRKLQLA